MCLGKETLPIVEVKKPRPIDLASAASHEPTGTAISPAEPGMNLISADFDVVMVNRANERLYQKPMVELLGKKCYREFEKRDEVCPYCPGTAALATGQPHEAESVGIRDDGSRFNAWLRAYPVQGLGDRPAGFIEIVEDITQATQAERLAEIESTLRVRVDGLQDVSRALREALEATLKLEDIDGGCVFVIDPLTKEHTLVVARGLSAEQVETLARTSSESIRGGTMPASDLALSFDQEQSAPGPRAMTAVPVLYREHLLAVLFLGSSAQDGLLPSTRAALPRLAAVVEAAIARIKAERSRGDAVADLEAFIAAVPLAVWCLDSKGNVTMWSRAAEHLFGWSTAEVLSRPLPFIPPGQAEKFGQLSEPIRRAEASRGRELECVRKDGMPLRIRAFTAPFRDVIGDASKTLAVAEDITYNVAP